MSNKLLKWYLAGPLFSVAERQFNSELAATLRVYGLEIFLPQDNEPRELTARNIFEADVAGINWADGVIGIMDGPDPDSGTSWEIGYAYANKKPIILLRTDFRGVGEAGLAPYNLMLTESATVHIELPAIKITSISEIARDIYRMIGVKEAL